jgi:hypothetical protein
MNCFICGNKLDEIRVDPRDLKPRPCGVCEEIIQETAFPPKDVPEYSLWDLFADLEDEEDFEPISKTSVVDA